MNEKTIKKNTRIYLFSAMIVLFGALGYIVLKVSGLTLTRIPISEYLLISLNEDGSYSYAIDTHRIKREFYFPEDNSLPENQSLESLSLIITPSWDQTFFEVGSFLDNAGALLKKGGYVLSETVWSWTSTQINQQYSKLLSVVKTISLKDYVYYQSDGNGNWIPYINFDSLVKSIGDRFLYDSTLKNAITSLSVSASAGTDNTLKIETWSIFSSSQGISINDVLHACGISLVDAVFIADKAEILKTILKPLNLQSYCMFIEREDGSLFLEIDKTSILSNFSLEQGSAAAKAVESLSIHASEQDNGYYVTIYSNVTDLDVINILYDNGIELSDSDFYIQK